MRKFNGHSVNEVLLIGIAVLLVSLASIFLFGDNIGKVFNNNTALSLFGGNRTTVQTLISQYLSNDNLVIGSMTLKAPVESIIQTQVLNGTAVQTSGSSGNIQQTVQVIQQYINELNQILSSNSTSIDSSTKSTIQTAISNYQSAISSYAQLNGTDATTQAVNLAANLDVSVKLSDQGSAATVLNSAISQINSNLTNSNVKTLLTTYSNNLLSLGESLQYNVNSRIYPTNTYFDYIDNNDNPTSTTCTASSCASTVFNSLKTLIGSCPSTNQTTIQSEVCPLINEADSTLSLTKLLSIESQIDTIINSSPAITINPSSIFTAGSTVALTKTSSSSIYSASGVINGTNYSFNFNTANYYSGKVNSNSCPNGVTKNINIDVTTTNPSSSSGKYILSNFLCTKNMANTYVECSIYYSTCQPNVTYEAYEISLNSGQYRVTPYTYTLCKLSNSNNCGYTTSQQADNCNGDTGLCYYTTTKSTSTTTDNTTTQATITSSEVDLNLKQLVTQGENELVSQADALDTVNLNNGTLTTAQQNFLNSYIDVYRDGNYSDILPDSYNTAVLCKTLGITPDSQGNCNIN